MKSPVRVTITGAAVQIGYQLAFSKVNGENKDIEWYLLDINMEEPNGIETAGELINAGVKNSKIALITGNRSVDFQDKAKEMGVCYINKAIGPQDVDAFVDRLRTFFSGSNE